jgi:hypothetical protein
MSNKLLEIALSPPTISRKQCHGFTTAVFTVFAQTFVSQENYFLKYVLGNLQLQE